MNGAPWIRHPLILLLTALIVAFYLYGYGSKISHTESYSPLKSPAARSF